MKLGKALATGVAEERPLVQEEVAQEELVQEELVIEGLVRGEGLATGETVHVGPAGAAREEVTAAR